MSARGFYLTSTTCLLAGFWLGGGILVLKLVFESTPIFLYYPVALFGLGAIYCACAGSQLEHREEAEDCWDRVVEREFIYEPYSEELEYIDPENL